MAITRLTDIITVFDSKWTYGDVKFGYESEVNQDHDTQYPLMLVEPPESTIPVVYNGREEYTFEINFYNLYSQAAQSAVTLQKRWDNLQDLANEWLDMVLKNYQDVSVEAYLEDESIAIERVKEVANDRLVQIKLTFTMSAFTKCFRPVSNYPSDYSDLTEWLKADSAATFDIASKRVSAWADQSGYEFGSNMTQTATANQALREGYGGANGKAYFNFDGTNDSFISENNFVTSTTNKNFTIFEVSQINKADNAVFGYHDLTNDRVIEMGTNSSGYYNFYMKNGSQELSKVLPNTVSDLGKPHISVMRYQNIQITYDYRSADWKYVDQPLQNINFFTPTTQWNTNKFKIGCALTSNGLTPPALIETRHLDGKVQEIIMYNRTLSNDEKDAVVGYLNLKYKIY